MDAYWRVLTACLAEATALIDPSHFALAVAGRAKPAIRERVYCYELYHHLRSRLPAVEAFPCLASIRFAASRQLLLPVVFEGDRLDLVGDSRRVARLT